MLRLDTSELTRKRSRRDPEKIHLVEDAANFAKSRLIFSNPSEIIKSFPRLSKDSLLREKPAHNELSSLIFKP